MLMLKIFSLFTILALSFAATNGWVGTWTVTNFIGNWNCGSPFPSVDSTIKITAKNATTLTITGTDNRGSSDTWDLPWGQYDTKGSDCKSGVSVCTSGDLETHGKTVNGQIKWFCGYKPQLEVYEGVSISYVSEIEVSNEKEGNFLNF